jgi:hypothetical protein
MEGQIAVGLDQSQLMKRDKNKGMNAKLNESNAAI